MEKVDIDQYKALMEDVEDAKKELNIESTDTILLLMIYDRLLGIGE